MARISRGWAWGISIAAGAMLGLAGCGGSGPAAGTGPGIDRGAGGTGSSIDPGAAAGAGGVATTPGADLSHRPDPALPVFDDGTLHQVDLEMSPDDWQSIIDDSRGDEWRHAKLTYDGAVIDDVGVKPSGEGSRIKGNVKQSVRVKFDAFDKPDAPHGHFAGLKEVTVKAEFDDASMMRERIALFVFRAMMPSPRAVHSRFSVNGGYRGVYTVREVWDSESIKAHFSEPLGPLYRLRPADPTADPYKFTSMDPMAYVPAMWVPYINHPMPGDEVIPHALAVVAMTPAMIEQVFDMDDLLAYLAVFAVVGNIDGFTGNSGVEDHFQYYDPKTGKFFILPWDPDNTFGSTNEPPDRTIYKRFSSNTLSLIVRDVGNFRARYKAKLTATMAAVPVDKVLAEIDRVYAQIKDAAYADPIKKIDNGWFDWSVTYIKDFATKRYANVADQVANGP